MKTSILRKRDERITKIKNNPKNFNDNKQKSVLHRK